MIAVLSVIRRKHHVLFVTRKNRFDALHAAFERFFRIAFDLLPSCQALSQKPLSVAQDSDPIGDRVHLFHAVGNVDDGDSLVLEPTDQVEQGLRLVPRQGRQEIVSSELIVCTPKTARLKSQSQINILL